MSILQIQQKNREGKNFLKYMIFVFRHFQEHSKSFKQRRRLFWVTATSS